MTAKELASWLRVNRKTVYEYAGRNVIPCRRLGRRLVFSRVAVAAWLALPDGKRRFRSRKRSALAAA
jgi:excisionase family DNA binding protein